ncbi:hypothetical protein IKZ77_03070 [Candidatus Saccharibacteria bacterium]|nr:hypothetical protein [Candidatus Saccharibacteria bacterium]
MDTGALDAEITRAKTTGSFNPDDRAGVQRMSALLQTMEARGKQKDIFDILRNNNLSDSSKVMQTLQASNNKVLKAYGKKGEGVSYNAFMTGTGPSSLSGYISEKGASFVDGIDDKALQEIKNQNVGAMGADLWVQAAARTNSQDAINVASKAVEEQIASGAFAGRDMGITADGFTTMNKTMAKAILDGYKQDYARTNPGLTPARIDAEARNTIAAVFDKQINAANNDVNIKSKVGQEVGEVFRINNGP